MKKKFTKILGVGLTLALLCSLLLTAAPVSAVTTPVVTLTGITANPAYEISKENIYTVLFTTGAKVPAAGEIVIVFEAGTNITGMVAADVLIESTAGLGGAQITPAQAVFAVGVTGIYPAAQTLTIQPTAAGVIGAGAIVQLTIGGAGAYVTNPDTAGSYHLTVATQTAVPVVIEAAVTSAAYTIIVPTIAGLPGVASVYNPVGILMAQKNVLSQAITAAGDNYTIYVGPGTYTGGVIDISHAGLTFVSTAGAATTIIDATGLTGYAVTVSGAGVTFDGFTVTTDTVGAIKVTGADAIVQNNIMTAAAGYPEGIHLAATGTGATVSGNVLDIYNTMMVIGATGATLSDNTFGAGINLQGSTGITITGNTLIGVEFTGIVFESSASSDILIEGNTISETTGAEGTGIYFRPSIGTYDGIQIVGNDITDNEGDGIEITTGNILTDSVIKFNTITGNDTTTGDYGIQNTSDTPIDATLNWWGTTVASEIAAMVSGTTVGIVDYEPFLAGTAAAVLSASDVAAGATSLNASTTVGVAVSGATDATVISVAKYIANPEEAIADAIAFYDVYVVTATADVDVTIKFYAGDANTAVYLWSRDTLIWAPVTPVTFSAYGGFVSVTVTADLLAGTPFALVGGAGAAPGTSNLLAPETGDDTVSLTPIFAWEAATNADGYYFQLADNANFVTPMVKLDGDLGRLVVTAYAYVGELPYSTAYYWRVKAVSGTVAAGDLAESPWSTGVFITMDEPVEPTPPVVVEEQPPVIIKPIVEVITPAATEITPSWIYVIIGVGAVLVIALLVLIVRTRRVA